MNRSRKKKIFSKRGQADKQEVATLFLSIKNTALMLEFLEDILTPVEFEAIALRWQIIKQLAAGVDQRSIAGNLGVSIGTITRGSRELRNPSGGFISMLKRYHLL